MTSEVLWRVKTNDIAVRSGGGVPLAAEIGSKGRRGTGKPGNCNGKLHGVEFCEDAAVASSRTNIRT